MAAKKDVGAEVARVDDKALEVQRRFAEMAQLLPDADDNGASRIVEALLNAKNPFDLNTPWEGESSKNLAGRIVQINGATVRKSDFADGLGVFLIVDAIDLHKGEPLTFTTGSISTVAQIVRAFVGGWLPLVAEIVQSERPTKDGYFPIHLRVIESKAGQGVDSPSGTDV